MLVKATEPKNAEGWRSQWLISKRLTSLAIG